MTKFITAALAVLMLAACGSSTNNNNNDVVAKAKQSEASEAQIHDKLATALQLHEYAGVQDTYTVPVGQPDVLQGEDGTQCEISDITVGKDRVAFLKNNEVGDDAANTLISPDEDAAVQVGVFQGSQASVCLEAARSALGW